MIEVSAILALMKFGAAQHMKDLLEQGKLYMQTIHSFRCQGGLTEIGIRDGRDELGNLVAAADADQSHSGLATATTPDKLGRVISSQAQRDASTDPATTSDSNVLGWELRSVDANGVTTTKTYNASGEVVSETKGTQTTTSSFNATTGRLESTTSGSTILALSYDAFGNVSRELNQTDTATTKDVTTTYDSLARPTQMSEAVSGRTQTGYDKWDG